MKNECRQPWHILPMNFQTTTRAVTLRLLGGGLCGPCSVLSPLIAILPAPTGQPKSTPAGTFLLSLARDPRRRKGGSSQLGIGGHAHDITVQERSRLACGSIHPLPVVPFTTATRIRADGGVQ